MREDSAETFEDEEEGPCDLIDSDDEDNGHSEPPFEDTGSPKVPPADAVYSKFVIMGRQYAAQLEDQRKQNLMSRKAARKSLDFDEVRPPRGKQL